MRTIYIDSEFKCHTANDGTRKTVETEVFEGKCQTFVEGFRLVPRGEAWTRKDGEVFEGEMVCAWKDYDQLEKAQITYERELLLEYQRLINELYEEVV